MDKFASIDTTKVPSGAVVTQLDPVNLGGINYHGWKIQFTKPVDTGKKDKQTKQEIISQKIDDSKAPIYDSITALLKAGKLNNPLLAKMLVSDTQEKLTIAKLMKQVAQLKIQFNK